MAAEQRQTLVAPAALPQAVLVRQSIPAGMVGAARRSAELAAVAEVARQGQTVSVQMVELENRMALLAEAVRTAARTAQTPLATRPAPVATTATLQVAGLATAGLAQAAVAALAELAREPIQAALAEMARLFGRKQAIARRLALVAVAVVAVRLLEVVAMVAVVARMAAAAVVVAIVFLRRALVALEAAA